MYGHDLTVAENLYVDESGRRRCRECCRERIRRHYAQRKVDPVDAARPEALHSSCCSCGREKFRDARTLCFDCSLNGRKTRDERARLTIDGVVAIECAPAWVKLDPVERRRWIEQQRQEAARAE